MRVRTVAIAVVAVVVSEGAPAHAQRREGARVTSVFNVKLPVGVKFGEILLPQRTYRVTLASAGFAFADPSTMVLVATVPAERSETSETVDVPRINIEQSGSSVAIVMRYGDRMARAVGVATDVTSKPGEALVILAGKTETTVNRPGPAEMSDRQLIERAVKRYFGSIKHCRDKVHRNRWGTDDPRFFRCVCPIIEKWRLPRIKSQLVFHLPLSKGRSGFSFTVTATGRITTCRVWTGANPPSPKTKVDQPASTKDPAKGASKKPLPTPDEAPETTPVPPGKAP
ncbi:hypothetical protein ACFL6C_10120 [Myxococcota bacterium]